MNFSPYYALDLLLCVALTTTTTTRLLVPKPAAGPGTRPVELKLCPCSGTSNLQAPPQSTPRTACVVGAAVISPKQKATWYGETMLSTTSQRSNHVGKLQGAVSPAARRNLESQSQTARALLGALK